MDLDIAFESESQFISFEDIGELNIEYTETDDSFDITFDDDGTALFTVNLEKAEAFSVDFTRDTTATFNVEFTPETFNIDFTPEDSFDVTLTGDEQFTVEFTAGSGGGSVLTEVTESVSLGPVVLVRSETNSGKEVYFSTQTVSYPQFTIGASGYPLSSSVYISQGSFTITGSVVSGTLTAFTEIKTNEEDGTVVDGAATFTGTQYQAAGDYTVTVIATGLSLDPTPVSSTQTTGSGWDRFVPAYWIVGSEPTSLPEASTGVRYGSQTVGGSSGDNIYLVTVNSGFRFNVGPYEIFENLVGTITGQTDISGASRDFNVYKMGAIGASGSAKYTLV